MEDFNPDLNIIMFKPKAVASSCSSSAYKFTKNASLIEFDDI